MAYPRDGMVSVRRHQVTQNRPPPISHQRDHVDAWRLIVMFIMSPFHGLPAPQFGMRLQPSPLFFTQCHFQIFLAKLQDGRLARKRNGIFLAFFTGAEPQSTELHPVHSGCKDNSGQRWCCPRTPRLASEFPEKNQANWAIICNLAG